MTLLQCQICNFMKKLTINSTIWGETNTERHIWIKQKMRTNIKLRWKFTQRNKFAIIINRCCMTYVLKNRLPFSPPPYHSYPLPYLCMINHAIVNRTKIDTWTIPKCHNAQANLRQPVDMVYQISRSPSLREKCVIPLKYIICAQRVQI